jgi:hypothetical protein
LRLFCKAGSTTFRAVLSINAIDEARMVETITHLPAGLPSETVAMH